MLQPLLLWYPLVVVEAEARSITLPHSQTKKLNKETQRWVIQREEILLHPWVEANHYNHSVYKYISHTLPLQNLFYKVTPNCLRQIQNDSDDNDFTPQNNARQVFI